MIDSSRLWPMLSSALPRLRRRLRAAVSAKGEAEIGWWLTHWEPAIRDGGFSPPDAADILGEAPADTYEGRRWQQARAEVKRVLDEAAIGDPDFFVNKVVVDIGPGPLGFPDACPARVSIGVEPLAQRYADAGLLLADSQAIYLAVGAEAIPLLASSVDVIVARNSLDHVEDPEAVIVECQRLLRPGGTLILNVDVEHTPTEAEPHSLRTAELKRWLAPMTLVHERELDHSHGHDGHAVVLVARQP
jgi:SAM-dependent methyltransferase